MSTPKPIFPWRERPLQPMRVASQIAGLSTTTLYRLAGQGKVSLKKLGGRTMVETSSLIALLESAKDWAPAAEHSDGSNG